MGKRTETGEVHEKLRGLRPRTNAWKHNCNLCWQRLGGGRETVWYQGRPYHKDCLEEEMELPLHRRFHKRK